MSVSIIVGRPREEVFDYLRDIANHAEFTDHYLEDWHLTRENTVGRGAGARFRVKAPLQRFSWMGVSFIEVDPPRRIVEAGRGGKFNRIRTMTTYTLEPAPDDGTRNEPAKAPNSDNVTLGSVFTTLPVGSTISN